MRFTVINRRNIPQFKGLTDVEGIIRHYEDGNTLIRHIAINVPHIGYCAFDHTELEPLDEEAKGVIVTMLLQGTVDWRYA